MQSLFFSFYLYFLSLDCASVRKGYLGGGDNLKYRKRIDFDGKEEVKTVWRGEGRGVWFCGEGRSLLSIYHMYLPLSRYDTLKKNERFEKEHCTAPTFNPPGPNRSSLHLFGEIFSSSYLDTPLYPRVPYRRNLTL